MTLWSEDVVTHSTEEILRSQTENKAWNKELRLKTAALINSRLAKHISWDEYMENRRLAERDVTECRRRAAILAAEITSRSKYSNSYAR